MILTDGQQCPKATYVCRRFEELQSDRANWESLWDDIGKFVVPRKDNIYGGQLAGERKGQYLFDGTSIHSNELLASALHGMLTNPATEFFGLTTGNSLLDKNDSVRKWFQQSVEIAHNIINNSNFQTEIHEVYTDLGGFGTATMLILEDKEHVVRFKAAPIFEVYIDESNKGMVDTVYRYFSYTVRQMKQEFGEDNVPESICNQEKTDKNKKYDIIHAVFPRTDDLVDKKLHRRHKNRKKWASFYVLKESKHTLSEGGFDEMPYVVPRWTKISGEKYGRSPGMKAMPDIKMLNEMSKVVLRASQLAIAPPISVTDDGMFRRVKMVPGALNYVRAGSEIKPIITGADIRLGDAMLEDTRNRVRQAFFIDQLQLNEGPQMTATEVMQRTEEKLRLMGPILGRQQFELLRPTVERIFKILMKGGHLPAMPEELAGRKIDVQYSSTIARAQKAADIDNFNRWFGNAMPLMEIDPNVADNLDTDAIFRGTAIALNVDQSFLKDQNEVAQVREQKQQQQAQQMQMMQEHQQSETVKNMSEAEVNEASAQKV